MPGSDLGTPLGSSTPYALTDPRRRTLQPPREALSPLAGAGLVGLGGGARVAGSAGSAGPTGTAGGANAARSSGASGLAGQSRAYGPLIPQDAEGISNISSSDSLAGQVNAEFDLLQKMMGELEASQAALMRQNRDVAEQNAQLRTHITAIAGSIIE